jgi:uncharacterized protein (DUF1501 family)
MDRRSFLKVAALSGCSIFVPGISGWALSNYKDKTEEKRLVVIFLRGGVDGLNVVAPYGDQSYYALRPTIAISKPGTENGVIDLDGYFGLHPALAPLMPYWKDGTMAFVHASGSPNETRSHFDAQDYMETGVPGKAVVFSGWLNRLVGQLPSEHSHLQALSLGPVLPRIFSGPAPVASVDRGAGSKMYLDKPAIEKQFADLYASRTDELGKAYRDGIAAHQAINKAMAMTAPNANDSKPTDPEQVIANKGAPLPKAFPSFGKQLADLFNKDGTTQVAFLDFGGWDTHVGQGTGKGQLANHLQPLAIGLGEFIDGIGSMYADTTIVVMSEFGRTAHENGNGGTDHGHGNAMWLLGGNIPGGKVYGRWNGLTPEALHEKRDLPTTTDFRAVLSYVLREQLAVTTQSLNSIFPDFKTNPSTVLVRA